MFYCAFRGSLFPFYSHMLTLVDSNKNEISMLVSKMLNIYLRETLFASLDGTETTASSMLALLFH